MKLTKSKLKEIIYESLQEQEEEQAAPAPSPEMTSREKKVQTGMGTGGLMSAQEYANTLKQVLLSKKISAGDRKKALVSIFGNKGSAVNSLVLQMMKGAQE